MSREYGLSTFQNFLVFFFKILKVKKCLFLKKIWLFFNFRIDVFLTINFETTDMVRGTRKDLSLWSQNL
jgi:hypothetical protein